MKYSPNNKILTKHTLKNAEYTGESAHYPTQSSKTTRIYTKEARTRKYECTHTSHRTQIKQNPPNPNLCKGKHHLNSVHFALLAYIYVHLICAMFDIS
jgi:hypothetical protein